MKGDKKYRKQKDEDLLDFMNTFLLDSSKTVTKIKEHVYSFLDISVGIGHQKKNFTSASLVISGCKQNLDDLKRIESLLKGYMNSKKEALNDAPELYQTDKASLYTSTSPTDLKGISGNENINYIQQMLSLKAENLESKEQISKLREQIKILRLGSKNEEIMKSPKSQLNKELVKGLSPGSSSKKVTLKKCKSQLFDTNRNLELIRKRNRQCLDMVKVLKEELDIIESDSQN